ncbi:MAG: hypothetical protein ACPHL6_12525 [Rubripirellula sp.]
MIKAKSGRLIRYCQLAIGVTTLLWIWLFVLPGIGRLEPVNRMIKQHRESGVDPSVMFYTEIDHLEFRDGMLRQKVD